MGGLMVKNYFRNTELSLTPYYFSSCLLLTVLALLFLKALVIIIDYTSVSEFYKNTARKTHISVFLLLSVFCFKAKADSKIYRFQFNFLNKIIEHFGILSCCICFFYSFIFCLLKLLGQPDRSVFIRAEYKN